MRFMMIVKASKKSEAGVMPSNELIAAMTKYNEALLKAGALVDLSGLQPSSKGARVKFSGEKRMVIDGPFAETKELIGGLAILQANSKEHAIELTKYFLSYAADGECELRQLHDANCADKMEQAQTAAKA